MRWRIPLVLALILFLVGTGLFYFRGPNANPSRESVASEARGGGEGTSGGGGPGTSAGEVKASSTPESEATSSAPTVAPAGPMRLPRFTGFSFPAPEKKQRHLENIVLLLRSPLEQSRYWTTGITVSVRGKQIPIRFLTIFTDTQGRRVPDPHSWFERPGDLGWLLLGYFNLDGKIIKWSTASLAETIAERDIMRYYLYQTFSSAEELGKYFDYIALPSPGQEGGEGLVLEPGNSKWKSAGKIYWDPLTEAEHRVFIERWERAAEF